MSVVVCQTLEFMIQRYQGHRQRATEDKKQDGRLPFAPGDKKGRDG